jgi:6-phosphogluconolactonase/glucosamine-6-phosphate isomerase/deaminase
MWVKVFRVAHERVAYQASEKPASVLGLATDVPAHCMAYEEAIADAGSIDLQILGLGFDGHLGFNEPGFSLASCTRNQLRLVDRIEAADEALRAIVRKYRAAR